jgi:transcription elongation factor Elf1
MRIEEQNNDWIRTWAFKLDEAKAEREGFNMENTRGSMKPAADYPGCPYCGSDSIARCSCGKLFCWHGEANRDGHASATCPWCGQTGDFELTEKINATGGGI